MPSCEGFPDMSVFQDNLQTYLSYILGTLACFACTKVGSDFLQLPTRSFSDPQSMIFFLALTDFFLGVTTVVEGLSPASESCGEQITEGVCIFKACSTQFFGLASFLWSASMSHESYTQIRTLFTSLSDSSATSLATMPWMNTSYSTSTAVRNEYKMTMYHVVCWGVPLITLIIMLATNSAGPSSSRLCWVTTQEAEDHSSLPLPVAMSLFILPLCIVALYNLYVFLYLRKYLLQMPSLGHGGQGNSVGKADDRSNNRSSSGSSTEGTSRSRSHTRGVARRRKRNNPLAHIFNTVAVLIVMKLIYLLARAVQLLLPPKQRSNEFLLSLFVIIVAPLQGLGDFFVFRYQQGQQQSTQNAGSTGHSNNSSGHSVDSVMDMSFEDDDGEEEDDEVAALEDDKLREASYNSGNSLFSFLSPLAYVGVRIGLETPKTSVYNPMRRASSAAQRSNSMMSMIRDFEDLGDDLVEVHIEANSTPKDETQRRLSRGATTGSTGGTKGRRDKSARTYEHLENIDEDEYDDDHRDTEFVEIELHTLSEHRDRHKLGR